ncbi:hypothetical protein Tco_1006293 [Tanacetum coccineum]|uniref:Uncharacterized protein n=1 Tax=Tanacetum coccineum TaxID=301880 RepID=A0ABQ5FII9_9ASTR
MTTPSPSPPFSLHNLLQGTRLARYEIGESSTARPARGQGIDYGFVGTVDAEERRQGIRNVGYGIRDTWVDLATCMPIEDARMVRSSISLRVDLNLAAGSIFTYGRDRMISRRQYGWWMEEAYAFTRAWDRSIGFEPATHQELQTHRDHVLQHTELAALRERLVVRRQGPDGRGSQIGHISGYEEREMSVQAG